MVSIPTEQFREKPRLKFRSNISECSKRLVGTRGIEDGMELGLRLAGSSPHYITPSLRPRGMPASLVPDAKYPTGRSSSSRSSCCGWWRESIPGVGTRNLNLLRWRANPSDGSWRVLPRFLHPGLPQDWWSLFALTGWSDGLFARHDPRQDLS